MYFNFRATLFLEFLALRLPLREVVCYNSKITVSVKIKRDVNEMSLFSSPVGDYNRRRPRTGVSLLLTIFVQEFFRIVTLNALFIVCSLPVITMPAAYAAMTRVNGYYVQEIACNQWKEFFRVFREEFKRTIPAGLILLLVPIGLSVVVLELMTDLWNAASYVALTLCLIAITILLLIRYYFFPLITWTQLSVREALRNSFMLAVVRLWPNLLMLAVHGVLFCLVVYYFPMSSPYLALCVFASVNLFSTFLAWGGIRRYILKAEPEEAPEQL